MASLWVGFTFPGMIDDPGSFSGRISSPRPARGPDASHRMSLAIFISDTASVRTAPLANTERVVRGERGELVVGVVERQARELGDLLRDAVGELRVGVQARADGGAADGQLVEPGERLVQPLDVGVELRHVPRELLAEGERHRVLQVGATDLDDVAERLGLLGEGVAQLRDRGDQPVHDLLGRGDVHRGRVGVVGRLRHVDVVVGVDGRLRALLTTGDLDRAVGDDLVHVHVRLGPAARLPHEQRELAVELAGEDLVGGGDDEIRLLGGELAEIAVGERGGLLQDRHPADHRGRHVVGADREVVQRALRLRAPVAVDGHLDRAHAVGLGPGRGTRRGVGRI